MAVEAVGGVGTVEAVGTVGAVEAVGTVGAGRSGVRSLLAREESESDRFLFSTPARRIAFDRRCRRSMLSVTARITVFI